MTGGEEFRSGNGEGSFPVHPAGRGRRVQQGRGCRLRALTSASCALRNSARLSGRRCLGSASHSRLPPSGRRRTYGLRWPATSPTRSTRRGGRGRTGSRRTARSPAACGRWRSRRCRTGRACRLRGRRRSTGTDVHRGKRDAGPGQGSGEGIAGVQGFLDFGRAREPAGRNGGVGGVGGGVLGRPAREGRLGGYVRASSFGWLLRGTCAPGVGRELRCVRGSLREFPGQGQSPAEVGGCWRCGSWR